MANKLSLEEQLASLYVATFGRAPDAEGLEYWMLKIESGEMTIEEVAQSFFDQPEAKQTFPSNSSLDTFISSVYNNVLDRDPDKAGLDYWKGELSSGNISKSEYILAIVNAAQEHPEDAKVLQDKCDIGLLFAYSDMSDIQAAHDVIEAYQVTHDKDRILSIIDRGYNRDDESIVVRNCENIIKNNSAQAYILHEEELSGTHIVEEIDLSGIAYDDMSDIVIS